MVRHSTNQLPPLAKKRVETKMEDKDGARTLIGFNINGETILKMILACQKPNFEWKDNQFRLKRIFEFPMIVNIFPAVVKIGLQSPILRTNIGGGFNDWSISDILGAKADIVGHRDTRNGGSGGRRGEYIHYYLFCVF